MSFPPSSRVSTAEAAVTSAAVADIYSVSGGLPLACVPSLPPPPPPSSSTNHGHHTHGSSSLRVRFRMTTRQSSQHQFRAKISSNSSSISQSPTYSSFPSSPPIIIAVTIVRHFIRLHQRWLLISYKITFGVLSINKRRNLKKSLKNIFYFIWNKMYQFIK